ncbi:hypothetical protein J3R83DRAFT_2946 [Lanmaoa asiatica]|nr:hypothetical protein J3R83DRAFT_2946 [Lanmaoa asiatica]
MSLAAAGLWITFLWLVIYAVKYSSRRPKPTTEVTVKYLNIRLRTEVFNVLHDELSTWLSPNKSRILRNILLRLYDVGSFVGVIGMLLGFCLLFLTAASLFSGILRTGRDGHHGASTVTKRELDHAGDTTPPIASTSDTLRINPIVSILLRFGVVRQWAQLKFIRYQG